MIGLSPFEAQAKLASLPTSPDSIKYLMALANGANPEIPRFMALGRLEQMKQEMANNKPAQPPQGTVKDKIEQAAGIMALRGGQQPQQPAMQPQAAPQGIPQPQMQPQPEEVQTGADGGLMRARIDPRMFDFAPGGIVSFSGKDRSDVSEDDTVYDPITGVPISGSKTRDGEDMTVREALGLGNVENRRALEKAARGEPKAPKASEAPRPPRTESEGPSTLGPAQQEYIRLIKQGMPPAMAEKVLQASMSATQPGIAGASGAVGSAPAAPRPPVAPAAPAATAPGLSQGVGELAKTLTPEVDESKVRAAYGKAAPTTRSIEEIAAEQNKIQELTGVGTYGKNRREQIANMRHEFEQSRPSTSEDVIDMIRAGARPGARAGDIAGEYSGQAKREREAKLAFSKAEDALKDAAEKADEAVRSGKASDIVRARDEERKAQADYKKAEVELEKSIMTTKTTASGQGLQAATQLETNKQTNATNVEINRLRNLTDIQVANIREAASKYGYDRPTESDRIFDKYSEILKSGGQKAADAFLADQARVRATVIGYKYEGPDTSTKDSKAVQDAINKRTAMIDTQLQSGNLKPEKEADLRARRERIAAQVRKEMGAEGGGGNRVVSEADIQATMKSSGKSRDEVVKAAQARGYTIQ
jgi:hypothetical protein